MLMNIFNVYDFNEKSLNIGIYDILYMNIYIFCIFFWGSLIE